MRTVNKCRCSSSMASSSWPSLAALSGSPDPEGVHDVGQWRPAGGWVAWQIAAALSGGLKDSHQMAFMLFSSSTSFGASPSALKMLCHNTFRNTILASSARELGVLQGVWR